MHKLLRLVYIVVLLAATFAPQVGGQELEVAAPALSKKSAKSTVKEAASGTTAESPHTRTLNPLCLRDVEYLPWHKPEWGWRLPFAVKEPLGQRRVGMIVSFAYAFPKDADPSSFRIVNSGGGELPCQSLLLDKDKNLHRVTFAIDILPNDTTSLLLYFDREPKPRPDYHTRLSLRSEGDTFVLENSRIRADLRAAKPVVAYLAPLDNSTGNQFCCGDLNITRLTRGSAPYLADSTCAPGSVFEDGPVRKTLEYLVTPKPPVPPYFCRFTMDVSSNCLFYEIANTDGTPPKGLGLSTAWYPGEGQSLEDDYLVYPGKEAIRKVGFNKDGVSPLPKAGSALAEGWYALEDSATGQTVGGLFDLSTAHINFSVYSHAGGYVVTLGQQGAPTIRAALVALPDHSSALNVRTAYLRFKSPPECAIGGVQERASCSAATAKPLPEGSAAIPPHQRAEAQGPSYSATPGKEIMNYGDNPNK